MKFGRTIRRLREERDISIAQFARKVGMSPTYLAPIERDVFPPPAEAKVARIAKALGQNPDELLALAGRVPSDLSRIIRKQPGETAKLIRAIDGLSGSDIERLVQMALKRQESPKRRARGGAQSSQSSQSQSSKTARVASRRRSRAAEV